jgi:hypothetical protein
LFCFILTSQVILHLQVILHWSLLLPSVWVALCTGIWKRRCSPYPVVANGLCSLGVGEYNFNIFQSGGIFSVCSTLIHEGQYFSVFCPSLVFQLHKLLKNDWSYPWIGICCVFGGEFFLLIWNVALCPITSGGNFSVPLALQPNRTVTLFFYFVPPWQESSLYVSVILGWRL